LRNDARFVNRGDMQFDVQIRKGAERAGRVRMSFQIIRLRRRSDQLSLGHLAQPGQGGSARQSWRS
jgi:hypothetical protein